MEIAAVTDADDSDAAYGFRVFRYRPGAAAVRCCAICPAGIIRTAAYDVDVPFMQLEQHGWDIHAV